MTFPKKVIINEVSPRDGWQNIPELIPTAVKVEYIKKIIDNGAEVVEITSFVSPKTVPQLADAAEVAAEIRRYAQEKDVELLCLALNRKGVERAKDAGLTYVDFVLSASEEHNMRNSRRTMEESLQDFKEMVKIAEGMKIQLSIACAFGSPFGDDVPVERVLRLCEEAQNCGVELIGLADSAGISTPLHVQEVLGAVIHNVYPANIVLHLHDTRGMAIANAYAALELGVMSFDAALGGLGGCPFIPGARGNIATEDLLNMLVGMGIETGLELGRTTDLAIEMGEAVGRLANSCLCSVWKV